MTGQPSPDRAHVTELFDSLRTTLRAERRRTATERRAFATFRTRVADVNCSAPGRQPSDSRAHGGQGALIVDAGGEDATRSSPVEEIRRAYEETVMALPFYETEYGEEYVQSLHAEFGPEVATAVTDSDCFGSAGKAALIDAIDRALCEREELLETCDRERDSVNAAAEMLVPVATELDSIDANDPTTDSFGTVEAYWHGLSRLKRTCDEAAATRQAEIADRRATYDSGTESPDICMYLYRSHESAYPILNVCATLARRATTLQSAYERALARHDGR